ncbi:hypothetical protein D3C72_638340 [compost metagenome]
MISLTHKQEFGLYDRGTFAIVIFTSSGTPGVLPEYFDETSPSSIVIAKQQNELGWFELDVTHGINKFDICRDLLLGGFAFNEEFSRKMASFFSERFS